MMIKQKIIKPIVMTVAPMLAFSCYESKFVNKGHIELPKGGEIRDMNNDGVFDLYFYGKKKQYKGYKVGELHVIETDVDGDGKRDLLLVKNGEYEILLNR